MNAREGHGRGRGREKVRRKKGREAKGEIRKED